MDRLVPDRLFSKLNIASKMLLGFMILVILTIMVAAYVLFSLQHINKLNRSIINVDVPAQEAADKMLDAVLVQDTYEKRYLILRSREMRSLFDKRGEEFTSWLERLKKLPDRANIPADKIEKLHRDYTDLFAKEVRALQAGATDKAQAISNRDMRKTLDELIDAIKSLSVSARRSQESKMQDISVSGRTAFMTTAVLCILTMVVGVVSGFIVTHHISSSLQKLKVGTERIADGDFEYDPQIRTEDEIGSLATAFLSMGKRLKKLEEMYLDASPLTRLPGGIAIENVLKKRIEMKQPIAFCVVDLDNFKAFNDRYGYANGSEVIKETAKVLEAAVKAKGSPEDFLGHIGGDDFVIITSPERMRVLAGEVIGRFDQRIPDFYSAEDRKAGYIAGKTRQGVDMKFPIMTISIAIVTNERRAFTDPLEVSEVAAELKDYAKTIPKSIFVIDKRRGA